MPTKNNTVVLSKEKVLQKLNRLIHQIHENVFDEKEIIIAGIDGYGYVIAERIAKELGEISKMKIILSKINMDKENPLAQPITLEGVSSAQYENKVILVVDDVINSGKTIIYAVNHFLDKPVKRIQTVVLVDRDHTRYPVKADYVGLSISTTLQENIRVSLEKNKEVIYLE
ncbi:MAG: phosphoribosyltransferase family protein [Bacteroidetes bacterium]|nr:phosphoribosyltransferase family protein [Bacteroidota bacterium]